MRLGGGPACVFRRSRCPKVAFPFPAATPLPLPPPPFPPPPFPPPPFPLPPPLAVLRPILPLPLATPPPFATLLRHLFANPPGSSPGAAASHGVAQVAAPECGCMAPARARIVWLASRKPHDSGCGTRCCALPHGAFSRHARPYSTPLTRTPPLSRHSTRTAPAAPRCAAPAGAIARRVAAAGKHASTNQLVWYEKVSTDAWEPKKSSVSRA
eukprot:scaffold112403_cov78-Phaeocystis_antarctica.AAC.6